MVELRKRLEVIEAFVAGRANTVYVRTNTESMCLQIRKVLEVVAFASLVANREAYAEVRADLAKDWHANRILKTVRSFNSHFYPVPVGAFVSPDEGPRRGFLPINELYLWPRHFSALYDKCGELLHATNPFSAERNFRAFSGRVPTYLLRIRALLRQHLIWLPGAQELLWVTVPDHASAPIQITPLARSG